MYVETVPTFWNFQASSHRRMMKKFLLICHIVAIYIALNNEKVEARTRMRASTNPGPVTFINRTAGPIYYVVYA